MIWLTLEQVASGDYGSQRFAIERLARELLALRSTVAGTLDAQYRTWSECEAEFRERLDALEHRARPLQEEPAMRLHVEHGPRRPHPFDTCRCGHMRMGHQEDGTCNATCGCDLFCLPYHHPDGTPDIFAGAAACDLVERAETSERERNEWQVRCGFETRRADAARAALAKIADPLFIADSQALKAYATDALNASAT